MNGRGNPSGSPRTFFEKIPEKQVQADCVRAWQMYGWEVLEFNKGVGGQKREDGSYNRAPVFATKGIPDTWCGHRQFGSLWVEYKRLGKKPTPEQLALHARLRKVGQRVVVIDNLDDCIALIKEMMGRE